MEQIFTDEIQSIVVAVISFFLIIVTSLYFLQRYKSKILLAQLAIADTILEKDFLGFLDVFKKTPSIIFDKLSQKSKDVIMNFLIENIRREYFDEIYEVYKFLEKKKDGSIKVFESAFITKHPTFWSKIYFVDFINNDGKKSEELNELFSNFYYVYHIKILREIVFDLNRFQYGMLHSSQPVLKERLEKEIDRLKEIVER